MVTCGKCNECCKGWNYEITVRPKLTKKEIKSKLYKHRYGKLDIGPDGNCFHMVDDKCTIYEDRPQICKDFDCRDLLSEFENRVFGRTIISALKNTGRME